MCLGEGRGGVAQRGCRSLPLTALGRLTGTEGVENISALGGNSLVSTVLRLSRRRRRGRTTRRTERRIGRRGGRRASVRRLSDNFATGKVLRMLRSKCNFVHSSGCLPKSKSICITPSRVHEFKLGANSVLAKGAEIGARKRGFDTLLCISAVGKLHPTRTVGEGGFRSLAPVFPGREVHLRGPNYAATVHVISLISPVKGKRENVVMSPPGTKGAALLGRITLSMRGARPGVRLLVLLVSRHPRRIASVHRTVRNPGMRIVRSAFSRLPRRRGQMSRVIVSETGHLMRRKGSIVVLLSDVAELSETCGLVIPPSKEALSNNLSPTTLCDPGHFFKTTEGVERNKDLAVLTATLISAKDGVSSIICRRFGKANGVRLVLSEGLRRGEIFPTVSVPGSKAEERSLLLAGRRRSTICVVEGTVGNVGSRRTISGLLGVFSHAGAGRRLIRRVVHRGFVWGNITLLGGI